MTSALDFICYVTRYLLSLVLRDLANDLVPLLLELQANLPYWPSPCRSWSWETVSSCSSLPHKEITPTFHTEAVPDHSSILSFIFFFFFKIICFILYLLYLSIKYHKQLWSKGCTKDLYIALSFILFFPSYQSLTFDLSSPSWVAISMWSPFTQEGFQSTPTWSPPQAQELAEHPSNVLWANPTCQDQDMKTAPAVWQPKGQSGTWSFKQAVGKHQLGCNACLYIYNVYVYIYA